MTPEMAMKAGMAAGRIFTRGEHRHRVVIGKDTRLSGYMIEIRAGRRLHRRGHGCVPVRPPAHAGRRDADALAARRLGRDDHRLAQPLHDNGIKFFGPDGQKLSDELEPQSKR